MVGDLDLRSLGPGLGHTSVSHVSLGGGGSLMEEVPRTKEEGYLSHFGEARGALGKLGELRGS